MISQTKNTLPAVVPDRPARLKEASVGSRDSDSAVVSILDFLEGREGPARRPPYHDWTYFSFGTDNERRSVQLRAPTDPSRQRRYRRPVSSDDFLAQYFEADGKSPERTADELVALLRASPVEEMRTHPGETILANLFDAFAWFTMTWLRGQRAAAFPLADLILLCGRIKPRDDEWRARMIDDWLRSSNIEIRDAATKAAELWGGERVLESLSSHRESVPWLANYIADVLEEHSFD